MSPHVTLSRMKCVYYHAIHAAYHIHLRRVGTIQSNDFESGSSPDPGSDFATILRIGHRRAELRTEVESFEPAAGAPKSQARFLWVNVTMPTGRKSFVVTLLS